MNQNEHVNNGIGHFDIAGPEVAALGRFYGGVFDWQVDEKGPGYALVGTPDGSPNGAIVEADEGSLTVGVVVPDLDAALAATERLGGTVVMPATDNGWVTKAQITDPAGNLLTLVKA